MRLRRYTFIRCICGLVRLTGWKCPACGYQP